MRQFRLYDKLKFAIGIGMKNNPVKTENFVDKGGILGYIYICHNWRNFTVLCNPKTDKKR